MYGNDVLRTAYLYVKDYSTAEDIFQEVFLKVNEKKSTFREESSIRTWIFRITINCCKDYLKSAYYRRVNVIEEIPETVTNYEEIEEQILKKEETKRIRTLLLMLPNKYREVLICIYYAQLSMKETAVCLHISEGTVKSRLSRAKNKMKKLLEGGAGYEG